MKVTILILIDGFLQLCLDDFNATDNNVTILILIDGFLQCFAIGGNETAKVSQSLF